MLQRGLDREQRFPHSVQMPELEEEPLLELVPEPLLELELPPELEFVAAPAQPEGVPLLPTS